jgi:FSR family fosmidomycin resistance protein-like MFS transporter
VGVVDMGMGLPLAAASVGTAPAVDAGPTRYAPLLGLAWLHFVNDGAANFLPGILPAVLIALNRSSALAGVLMFVLVAGQALQPLTGLFDRAIGRRRLIWFGAAGAAIGMGLVGFVGNLSWLLAVLALIGLAGACFHPHALATARVYAGRRGHFGTSIMLLGGEIGSGMWPLIAGAVVKWGSLSLLWIPALIVLTTLPLVHRFMPAPPVAGGEWNVRLRGRRAASVRLLGYAMLRSMAVIGAIAYLPLLWERLGGGLVGGAALVTTMSIVGLAGLLYGGHLADQIGRQQVLAAAGVLLALGLALVASGNPVALWAGVVVAGMAAFATYPVTTLEGQDLYPENPAFGAGIASGLGNALGAGLVALAGLLASWWPLAALFWLFSAAALATVPLGLLTVSARDNPGKTQVSRETT